MLIENFKHPLFLYGKDAANFVRNIRYKLKWFAIYCIFSENKGIPIADKTQFHL